MAACEDVLVGAITPDRKWDWIKEEMADRQQSRPWWPPSGTGTEQVTVKSQKPAVQAVLEPSNDLWCIFPFSLVHLGCCDDCQLS